MAGARGEGILKLPDGEERAVLFTNRALADAERVLGKSVTALLKGMLADGKLPEVSVTETAWLLQIGMEHARRDTKSRQQPYTLDEAFAVLDLLGYLAVVAVVVEAFLAAFSYETEGENPPAPPLAVGKPPNGTGTSS